jgi:CO dehydrogenase maturation factor
MSELRKIAISGKGGVGKTTLAALLAYLYAERGRQVIAIDADPVGGLAEALGLPAELAARVQPISEMENLIQERTGAKPGTIGGFFSLNPRVDDIPERFSVTHHGIRFLRLGTIEAGGSGCICPESALLKALVTHLLLYRDEMLILDMEAGVEHLGRATAQAVDAFLVVVEPGRRSLSTAARVRELAADLGIERVYAVGNKVQSERDWAFIQAESPVPALGYLSANPELTEADRRGVGVFEAAPRSVAEARAILAALEALKSGAPTGTEPAGGW